MILLSFTESDREVAKVPVTGRETERDHVPLRRALFATRGAKTQHQRAARDHVPDWVII